LCFVFAFSISFVFFFSFFFVSFSLCWTSYILFQALKEEVTKIRGELHTANSEVRRLAELVVARDGEIQRLLSLLSERDKQILRLTEELAVVKAAGACSFAQLLQSQSAQSKSGREKLKLQMLRRKKRFCFVLFCFVLVFFAVSLFLKFFVAQAQELKHAESMLHEALKQNEGWKKRRKKKKELMNVFHVRAEKAIREARSRDCVNPEQTFVMNKKKSTVV
jgi:hypothetical protein